MATEKDVEQQLRTHYQMTTTDQGSVDRLREAVATIGNGPHHIDDPPHVLRRRWLPPIVAAVVVVAAAVTAFVIADSTGHPSQHQAGTPTTSQSHPVAPPPNLPLTPLPTTLPTPHQQGNVCVMNRVLPSANGGRPPVVSGKSVGAVIIWLPGGGLVPCQVVKTSVSESVARQLAQAINASPAAFTGPVNCGMDTGAEVQVYFRLSGTTQTELLTIDADGCRLVRADGFRPRRTLVPGNEVLKVLEGVAPAGWKKHLQTGQ
jgi:hypothetical protein